MQLTNEGIELLSWMPSLKSLYVQCPDEGSPGLKLLSQLRQIEKLILLDEVGPDTEGIIRQIVAMPKLKDLRLIRLFPTLKCFKVLAQSAIIEHIYIKSNETLTLDAVRQLAEMKALTSVEYICQIEPAALAFLQERGLISEEAQLLPLPR